jgi:predicted DNA-binding transcriptional regulator AlpA
MAREFNLQPRLLALADACQYLSMSRDTFNSEVRPFIEEIKLGRRKFFYDRKELDRWIESRKLLQQKTGQKTWLRHAHRESSLNQMEAEPSTSNGRDSAFLSGSEKSPKKKPKRSLRKNSAALTGPAASSGKPSRLDSVMSLCSQIALAAS